MKKIKSNWHKQSLQAKFLSLEAKNSKRLSRSVFITVLIKPNSFSCSPWVSTSLMGILGSKCQTFFIPELQFLILWLTFESWAMRLKLFHLGARLTVELLSEFILLRRNKNVIRFSTAEKLLLQLKFLSNTSNFTSVNVLQSEITEALINTVKVSASKKLVLTISIAVCIAIQQYLKECSMHLQQQWKYLL